MKRFLIIAAAAFALLLTGVGLFARVVDPYDYWGSPAIDGLNRYRPASVKHLPAVKQRQYERLRPTTVVAGNSRVDVGIDPASPAWPAAMQPVYNFGLPGTDTPGVVSNLIDAAKVHRPKAIFLAVDFVDFRIAERDWRTFESSNTRSSSRGVVGILRQSTETVLSLDALFDSLLAVAEQRSPYPAHITPAGYNGLGEYNQIVAAEGHAALFEQRNRENIRRYIQGPKAVAWPDRGGSAQWAALEDLARYCRENGIRLVLFTYPYHADLLLAFDRTGLWPAFGDWQRRLAALGAREGVPVWTFTRLDSATTEAVPAPGDTKTKLGWYWEGGHFKAALGERMVRAMLGQGGFGAPLTPATAEIEFRRLGSDIASYRRANPAAAARLDASYRAIAERGLPSSAR